MNSISSLIYGYALLLLFPTIIYFSYVYIFHKGLKQLPKDLSFKKPFVSVVVAARNEEKNIGKLLLILMNQSYPTNLYEVIIADDESSDHTKQIAEEYTENFYNLRVFTAKGRNKVKSPKKNALSQAIRRSSGEIILTTDADCRMGSHWIEAMVANFTDGIDMVTGFSQTMIIDWKRAKFYQKFEHYDFLLMFIAAAGAISSGKIFSCSGQNLAYRRDSFDSVNGFEKIKNYISGDDVNLMQLFRKNGLKIRFSFISHSFVKTLPVNSLRQLISQRTRWASNMKWQIFLNTEFFLYLLSFLYVVYIPIYLLTNSLLFAIVILLLRIGFELSLIIDGFRIFHIKNERKSYYAIWFLLQPFYILIVAFLSLFNFFKWKK